MLLDGSANAALILFQRRPGCDAPRQIRHVRRPITLCFLEHGCKLETHAFCNPAAFSTHFKVPAGLSSPGWPGIVTTFSFDGCLN